MAMFIDHFLDQLLKKEKIQRHTDEHQPNEMRVEYVALLNDLT